MDATQIVASPNRNEKSQGPKGLRAGFSTLARLSPDLAAWAAERLWFTPPRPKIPKAARQIMARGRALPLEVEGRRFAAWRFGEGPAVLLMHGWGGYAAQLGGLIEPLVGAGFSVVAFDALGHGGSAASAQGFRLATFFDFAAGMRGLEAQLGPFRGLIAHSGGALATAIALRAGLTVERAVLLAPMARPALYASFYSRALGLDAKVSARWQARAHSRLGLHWSDFDAASGRYPTPPPPALVIHDPEDKEVPFADGRAIAESWPSAELHSVQGLGHRRLLKDPAVIARAVAFLKTVPV